MELRKEKEKCGYADVGGLTFSGSATGKRFVVETRGHVNTGGEDPSTYFPGDDAGTTDDATFGLYA